MVYPRIIVLSFLATRTVISFGYISFLFKELSALNFPSEIVSNVKENLKVKIVGADT